MRSPGPKAAPSFLSWITGGSGRQGLRGSSGAAGEFGPALTADPRSACGVGSICGRGDSVGAEVQRGPLSAPGQQVQGWQSPIPGLDAPLLRGRQDPGPNAGLRYAGVVLNEFWATATASYKVLVFGAMGLIAAGIVLNIVGNVSQNQGVAIASLPVIGAGLLLHGAGRVVRGWKVRRMLRN